VIFLGFPVYGGRVPITAMKRFYGLKGNNSKIVIVSTHGNIHYDDALIEMYQTIKNQGFTVIGMGAFVYQHNVIKNIGVDRPNKDDYELIKYFSQKLIEKLNGNEELAIEMEKTISFGKHPPRLFSPKIRDNCVECGLYIKLCPENAIDENNPRKTNKKCIPCMRCVKYCPNNAKDLSRIEYFFGRIFIETIRRIRYKKDNESEIIV
jgi:ferredoxin